MKTPPTVLVGEVTGPAWERKLDDAGFGRLAIARVFRPGPREPWAIDNGAWRQYAAGARSVDEYDRTPFLRTVERWRAGDYGRTPPRFVVLPDVVGDGAASLAESVTWLHNLEPDAADWRSGAPWVWYLAVQDGMTPDVLDEDCGVDCCDDTLWRHLSGIFLGGSARFKRREAQAWCDEAHARGLAFHYGRCGTLAKLEHAYTIGADSIDSAFPMWTHDRWHTFVAAYRALGAPREQLTLFATE